MDFTGGNADCGVFSHPPPPGPTPSTPLYPEEAKKKKKKKKKDKDRDGNAKQTAKDTDHLDVKTDKGERNKSRSPNRRTRGRKSPRPGTDYRVVCAPKP